MTIRDFDPSLGQAFQGDIAFVALPRAIKVEVGDEVSPIDGRLIIQEGEQSGHHHAIAIPSRNFKPTTEVGDPVLKMRSRKLRTAFGAPLSAAGSARMYRDPGAVEALRRAGILTRADLAIGCLVVEGEPAVVTHQEHDGIRLPIGTYYVGRQVESAGAEERVVRD